MATLETLYARLEKGKAKRDRAAATVKALQAEINRIETQEIINTLNELRLSPAEAKAFLQKAKSTIVETAQQLEEDDNLPGEESEEGGRDV